MDHAADLYADAGSKQNPVRPGSGDPVGPVTVVFKQGHNKDGHAHKKRAERDPCID